MRDSVDDPEALTPDERAAARAFLARCEVRLSTFHRIAVGMLSGAGLLVVLPVVARDSVTGILRSLLLDSVGATDCRLGDRDGGGAAHSPCLRSGSCSPT